MEQGKTGGLAIDKGEQRLELPLGSEAMAAQIFFGGEPRRCRDADHWLWPAVARALKRERSCID
jgi:hypothetical protein